MSNRFFASSRSVASAVIIVVALWMCLSASALTVVIDPGHGGHDAGALGVTAREKDINLAVAKRLERLIREGMPEAKVVMTRSTDEFISLQGRCDIANRAKGDLFISIHTNSVALDSPRRNTVAGASVYTLGLDRAGKNLDVAMRENAVMTLEDDYSATYRGFDPNSTESYIMFELVQSVDIDQSNLLAKELQNGLVEIAGRKDNGVRQAPFWVLVHTSMPAVLVELDFVCNPQVEEFLSCEEGRDSLARALFEGLKRYCYTGSSVALINKDATSKAPSVKPYRPGRKKPRHHAEERQQPDPSPQQPEPFTTADTAIIYKVQFLTAPRALPQGHASFKGLEDVESYEDGGIVKFTVGSHSRLNDAKEHLTRVRRQFPDAFIIKTQGGRRVK